MNSNSNKIIELNNVSKSFFYGNNENKILDNISTSITAGEFVSITGPSGAGKSTLLYLMGGLDNPTSGSIKINNIDITKINDKEKSALRRKKVSVVFQFYNLVQDLNVSQNILLPLALDGKNVSHYTNELDDLLELINLKSKKNFLPSELSGGQQQRVALARALINNPDIILADEPTGNLDSKSCSDVMNLLNDINKFKKKTIVLVTHSNEVAKYANKNIFIKDGKIFK